MNQTQACDPRPVINLPVWTWLAAAAAVAMFWAVTMEVGAVSVALGQSGPFLHELFHDGRHLIGVPCH